MKKVKVIFPDGSTAEIDEVDLQSALSAGAKRFSGSDTSKAKSTSMVFPDGSIADISEDEIENATSAGAIKKKVGGSGIVEDANITTTQSVPTTLQSTLPENDYSFDPLKGIVSDKVGQPVIQQQNGNVLSINTKTIPITPYSNPISYVKDLQQRIDTGKITKQDEDFLNKNQRGNQNFDAIDDSELMSLAVKYIPEITINENTDRLVIAKQLKDQVYDRFNKRYEGAEAVPDLDETSKKEIERLTELEKKLSFEKNKSEAYPIFVEAAIRTDESGNLWNKFTNRVLSAFPTTAAAGAAGIALEAVDTKQRLPTEFSIGLNGLKYTEPIQFERVTNSLLKGEPLSESMVAQITAQGLEAKEAMNKDAFVNEDIDKEQYEKQANEIQVSRYENIVNNKETLRAFISSGIANIADDVNVAKSATTDVNSFLVDKFFGHKWNYSDDEIERYGKAYAQANGIDPNDARVKEAIKYLQNNEGSMIMENSIAKTGWARDFSKGLATPIRGIASTIEDIGKTTADVYAEGQSQGNVNVSEQKIERAKNSWEGTVSDVLEGTGQFVTQAALALGVSSGIGAVGRTILGRAGVAALEGDIALADIGATNLVGKTLLGSKDALATFVTAYGQSYDSNLKQSLTYTADNDKARITANVMSGLEGATELFLSPIAVARGIGRNLFNKATTSKGIVNILSDAAILDKNAAVKSFLKGTIKVVGTEISEEQVVQLADYASNAILNPNSKTFQDRDLMNELANTAYQTGLSMALPALVSGVGAANVNNFSKGSLIIAAQNRQQLLDDMNKRLYDGDMSQDEYNEKAAIINTASNANATLPLKENGQKLNSEEKADYIFSRVSEGILTDKVKESADEAEKVILNKKIKNEQNFRTDMLGEKEEVQQPETPTTEPIQVDEENTLTKDEQDAIDGFNGITFTGSTKNWTDVIQSETSTPQEKKQALTELKEQLSDPNSEIATGAALGKSADLIYNLIDADKPKIESTPEETGIVVTPPESFPEPITIGEKIEPKTTEPITVSEPSTEVKSEGLGDVIELGNGNKLVKNEQRSVKAGKEFVFDENSYDIENSSGENIGRVHVADKGGYYQISNINLNQQKTGLGTEIYTTLINKLDKPLYSDRSLSGAAKGVWESLVRKGIAEKFNDVYTIDNKTYTEERYRTIAKSETKPIQKQADKVTEVPITETPKSGTDEGVNKVSQPTKKDIAKEKRIADFNKKADNVGKSIIDLLTPSHTKGIKKSGLGVEEIVNAAISAIKKANEAGENIKAAIETAIKYIKDNLGSDWNDNFEQPLRDRFNDIIDNEPPTGDTGDTTTGKEGKPKIRSVYKNIIERSKLPEKQKKLLRDDPQALYEVLPNDKAKEIALQIVEEMGVENAVAEASRSTSGLEPFEKVMILGAAMDHYSGLAKEAAKNKNNKDANHNADLEIDAQEKMQQAAQELAKLGTSLGRGINMFNEVYKLSNIALERKLKKQVNELNKLLNPQVEEAVTVVKDILEDDTITGIGNGMNDTDAQQMADLKSRVSALEKEIEDLKKQVAARANAPAGSKKNPLNIVRKTNTTEYAKRLKEFAQRHRTGLNADDLSDLTYFGLYHIENGVTKFADWFGLMSAKFSKFKEHLRSTYLSAKDSAIQSGADATLFDNEDGIDNHLTDLQDKSDAKKMLQLTKRKAIAANNRKNENNPDQARKEAPRFAAERIRNDAARNLGMLTTKNEQTYLKKLIQTIQTKAREYYKEKKENISNVNDILAFAIANGKSDYAIWERTQEAVESQIDADENLSDDEKEEVKGFLKDYTDSIFETLLTGRQQEEIIRQKLIDAGYNTERTINGKVVKAVDWNKVIGSAKNIKEAKAAIKKAILDVGFTEAEAKNEIDAVLNQFDNKVLEKKQSAINSYLKKGIINKVKGALGIGNNKTKIQKLVDMNNKGILDDTRIKEVLAKDLGIISLSDEDLKTIRELTTLIDNPKIPAFQKKKYEEQLQYLFDSKGGNLTYLEFREFLANNRLTSMYNNIQNLTGWFRAISTYITVAIKTGSPIKTAKVFNKAFKESISDALTILLHGDVSRGTAFADLTRSTEGEPRVRYLEQGKGKLLGLPDAYVRVGKKAINLNIFNTAYKGVKYVARVLESADTVPSNVISGLTQYWQIRKQLQFLHPEMSSKQIEAKAYATMNSVGLAEASKEAMEGFNEAGVTPSKYQLNRAIHEINERNRNELLSKEFYDRLEETKKEAEQRLINNGNPTPTGEEITKEAYLILGRDEPLDVVARGERQALRETGKKSTFGLAGLILWPLNALNQGLKKGMLANHTNTERWVINSGDAAITFLLPYANSIGRWVEMGIELTPYGVLKGLAYKGGAANLFEGLREGRITKEELSELGDDYLIRGVQGSAMLLSAMYLISLLNGGDDDEEEKTIDVTGTYRNPNFPKEKIQSVGKPDQTLTVKGYKIPLGLIGNAAYPLIMFQDFLDKRTNDNEKHGVLYTTAAVYLTTSAQSVQSRLGTYGGIISGIQSGKEDRYLPQLGKVAGSNVGASLIPFNRLQQEVGQLWNPKSEQSLTFGENLLQQFSIVGALGKAHPSFDYRGREYDFGEVFTGSADGIVRMFEKSKRADNIDRKLAEIDFGATDAFRESKDEENYKYTITDKEGNNRFMTTTEYYDFRKMTAQKFNEKITKNFDIVDNVSIKVKGEVDENLTKETMNDTYSDMLTTAKEQALELVQAQTGFIPSKKAISTIEKKENKSILKQKKRQLKRLYYE